MLTSELATDPAELASAVRSKGELPLLEPVIQEFVAVAEIEPHRRELRLIIRTPRSAPPGWPRAGKRRRISPTSSWTAFPTTPPPHAHSRGRDHGGADDRDRDRGTVGLPKHGAARPRSTERHYSDLSPCEHECKHVPARNDGVMPFADDLLGVGVAGTLTHCIQNTQPERALHALPRACETFDGLSLRERADVLRNALLADIPGDYATLAHVIRSAAANEPAFTGWLIWPVTSAIATRAVDEGTEASFDDALALLAELTGRLTGEFAIRTLLRHDLDRALDVIGGWTISPDEHVRRLASEGTRPYLPWAIRVPALIAQPGATIGILDALYRDGSEYVRRSVANHLNDLSRDSPGLVVSTARRWLATPAPTTPALVRHALRTLVKRGDPHALTLLGFAPATVEIDGPLLTETHIPWGGEVGFTATVRNSGTQSARLAIDYVVHHRRANGTLTTKVFKLTTAHVAPGEEFAIERRHSFRAITTRRYYPGEHAIALQVNGVATPPVVFELLPAADSPA